LTSRPELENSQGQKTPVEASTAPGPVDRP